jgi:hypothetical protein
MLTVLGRLGNMHSKGGFFMDIVLHGVVHGKTIELERNPGIDDGRVVQVVLNVEPSASAGKSAAVGYITAAGMMANYTEDDDAVLAEIYEDRRRDTRPEIAP